MPILIAITFHEAAHAFAAWRFGDDTAHRLGLPAFRSPTTILDHALGIVGRGCDDPAWTSGTMGDTGLPTSIGSMPGMAPLTALS